MSRSGTLQDALRAVDEFRKRAVSPSALRRGGGEASREVDGESAKQKRREKGREERKVERREKRRREKSSKEEVRRKGSSGREKDKQRRKKSGKRGGHDEADSSDEDDIDEKEKRRAERKKERRAHRKKERADSSKRPERKSEKKSSGRSGEGKQQQQQRQFGTAGLRGAEGDTSASEKEDSIFGSESSKSEGDNSASGAEQVVATIIQEFPEVEDDLLQLLRLLDDGQAVDVSGLPNECLVALLRKLFRSLHLCKSPAGLYMLPATSQPTLSHLGGLLSQARKREALSHPQPPPALSGDPSTPGDDSTQVSKQEVPSSPRDSAPAPASGAQKRRMIGPAMPTAEMLEVAAKLTEAEQAWRDTEAEMENDPIIGPPPPGAVAEASSANEAERFEEVTRIMAPDIEDAYDILGLKRGVDAAGLKKRYWKLSLLVHPDKCQHPQAHQAFMALNKAFKDLQDPVKRSEIDRQADAKEAKEEYETEMRSKREAAQWRKLRGEEALPGDAELLQGEVKPLVREEWMTELPPERKVGGPPSQHNTFFSRSEKSGRGDTSVWTDTPLQKAEKAKMQYLEAYKQAALTGAAEEAPSFAREKSERAATLMDNYNEKKRSTTLLEEHRVNISKDLKKAKKGKSTGNPSSEPEKKEWWADSHPWRPWDREKDLAAGRQAVKWDDKKASKEGLTSRFSSNSQRTFL